MYLLSGRQIKLGLMYNAIEILVLKPEKTLEQRLSLLHKLLEYTDYSDTLLRPTFSHKHMYLMYI